MEYEANLNTLSIPHRLLHLHFPTQFDILQLQFFNLNLCVVEDEDVQGKKSVPDSVHYASM